MKIFQIIFNSDLKFVPILSNVDRKYFQYIIKKKGNCSASKQEYSRVLALGSYKEEGGTSGTIASLLFWSTFVFFTLHY